MARSRPVGSRALSASVAAHSGCNLRCKAGFGSKSRRIDLCRWMGRRAVSKGYRNEKPLFLGAFAKSGGEWDFLEKCPPLGGLGFTNLGGALECARHEHTPCGATDPAVLPPLGASISIPSEPARSGQMTRSPSLSAEKGSNPVDRFLMCASGQLGPWDRTPQQTVLDGVLSTAALRHSSRPGSQSPKTHCKELTRRPSPAPAQNQHSKPIEVPSVRQRLTPPWQSLFALIGGGRSATNGHQALAAHLDVGHVLEVFPSAAPPQPRLLGQLPVALVALPHLFVL